MKDYIELATCALQHACIDKQSYAGENSLLMHCCLSLADGVEFCLRHVAVTANMSAMHALDLTNLVNYVSNHIMHYTWFASLKHVAPTLCNWSRHKLFVIEFNETTESVNNVLALLECMVDDLKNFEPAAIDENDWEIRVQSFLNIHKFNMAVDDIRHLLPVTVKDPNISDKQLSFAIKQVVAAMRQD